jgi:diaminopimelate epimerase
MIIPFNKYQGTGNDFIIIDNRNGFFNPPEPEKIRWLCNRRFGIGADGLILISNYPPSDFEMKYYNADGNESSMCGNGGRCAADFALRNGIAGSTQVFKAFDGIHHAKLENDIIHLELNDVLIPTVKDDNYFMNTGSPHYVIFVKNVSETDVYNEGKKLRWSDKFSPEGTNVNFVEIRQDGIFVRTFERGVEDETLSCGTGVTASAIATALSGQIDSDIIPVSTRGGDLTVRFKPGNEKITDIWLSGPAMFIFNGNIEFRE